MAQNTVSNGMKLLISGGGTGGHIYPGIAVIQGLLQIQPNAQFGYVGKKNGLEEQIVTNSGLPITFFGIEAQGLSRKISVTNVRALFKNYYGYKQATQVISQFRPDVVFGTGGYVSVSTVYAAQRKKIPTLILEQNLIPGLANKFLGKRATAIAVSFPETSAYFPIGKVTVTGTPVRLPKQTVSKAEARQLFGLEPDVFTLLVFGGSQGSLTINRAIVSALPILEERNIKLQIILQTGQKNYPNIVEQVKTSKIKVIILPYIHEMMNAYTAADLVICRAGAISIAEITVCGVPAILIPYPYATANHQEKNARMLEQHGAAKVVLERELTTSNLVELIAALMQNKQKLSIMAEKSRQLGKPNATFDLCKLIQQLANNKFISATAD
ncbi:MAG: undecaprenyldiphospho-muramoylpentapeptide beta-N-acetylglucosaminyltransferase [bacterium]|nr:undecaprenyldiphospho-muramoylpentapeptide beta-N-acetylglucosaminyltransferase [bacterium]